MAVTPIGGSNYANCLDFLLAATNDTGYADGGCVPPSAGSMGQSMRYACSSFNSAIVTLNGLDSSLPSAAVAATTTTAPTPAVSLARTTTNGPVEGIHLSADVTGWLGVRFAAPPNGTLRWRPPHPVQPWTTPIATTVHKSCFAHADHGITLGSEGDCLTVDVWAPAAAVPDVTTLPVMVWIHGGAFVDFEPVFAAANPTKLVEASVQQGTPVIVVSINYRMGGLGYMGLRELAEEEGSFNSSGNYGMLDQVMALHWVRDNIHNWGGSPSRVTIFGESAGAYSVCTHLASPLSHGLFNAAILESAYCGIVYIYAPVAESVGDACKQKSNCTTVECMRQLDVSTAYNCMFPNLAKDGYLGTSSPNGDLLIAQVLPNIDGYFLTGPPIAEIQSRASVPVMVGSNFREMMLFAFSPDLERAQFHWDMDATGLAAFAENLINSMAYRRFSEGNSPPPFATPGMVDRLLAQYPIADYTAFALEAFPLFHDVLCHTSLPQLPCNFTAAAACAIAMGTDAFFTFTAATIADAAASGGQPAYRYLFKQSLNNATGPVGNLFNGAGAFHSLDVPFVFNTFSTYANTTFGPALTEWTPTADEATLSAQMQRYWLNFAVFGSPNGNGVVSSAPMWPAWTAPSHGGASEGQYMQLVEPGLGAGSGFHSDALVALGGFSDTGATVALASVSASPTPAPQNPQPTATRSKLSAGDGAGIAVAAMAVLLVVGIVFSFSRSKKVEAPTKYTELSHSGNAYEADGDTNPTYGYATA